MIASVLAAYSLALGVASLVYRSSADKAKVRSYAAYAGGLMALVSALFWVASAIAARRSLEFNDALAVSSANWNLAAAIAASAAAVLLVVPALFDRWEARKRRRQD